VFDHIVWPETLVGNRNQMSNADAAEIMEKFSVQQVIDPTYLPFGDGHACEKIAHLIDLFFRKAREQPNSGFTLKRQYVLFIRHKQKLQNCG